MRFPRFRFSIRGFMVAVAATTLLVVGGIQVEKGVQMRGFCLMIAEDHAVREQEERRKINDVATLRGKGLDTDPLVPIYEDLARARLEFHARMRLKWEQAARRPWQSIQSIADDPDEPTDERIVKKIDLGPLPYIKDDIQKLAIDPPAQPR